MAMERVPRNVAIFATATSPCTGKCLTSVAHLVVVPLTAVGEYQV